MTHDPLQYGTGYPCLYGLTEALPRLIKRNGVYEEVLKNGTSWSIATRKSHAITYCASRPVYQYVIVLSKEAFPDRSDLYLLDAEFVEYLKENGLGQYWIAEGGGQEWFSCACPQSYLTLRLAFLETKGLAPLAVLTSDPFPLRDLTEVEKTEMEVEDRIRKAPRPPSRLQRLIAFQAPHLRTLREFLVSPEVLAALVTAPCGYGKTVVSAKALKGLIDRFFVCVPTEYLKTSWKKALLEHGGFAESELYEVGGKNGIDLNSLPELLKKPRFGLLLCYASSHLLLPYLTSQIQLGISDEAHRLAGVADLGLEDSEEKKQDVGRTKRLIRKAAELGIKRLNLTFTPKGYTMDDSFEGLLNSNDDVYLFGDQILKISLREMIEAKLLPPYTIRIPYVKTMEEGLKAKIQLVLHEFQRGMNHLILFGATHKDCKEILGYLQELLPVEQGVECVYLDTAQSVPEGIRRFTTASRSILVNCLLLGEGVDLPIADSVCILCNKESYVQIVQMLLRPGRYFPGKESFHMILALNDDDDTEFAAFVLDALARIDPLLDKQILRLTLSPALEGSTEVAASSSDKALEDVIRSEDADGFDLPRIKACLEKVIRRRIGQVTTRFQFAQLRESCQRAGIRNTSSYNAIREQFGWPEAPWTIRDLTAYEFFHSVPRGPLSQDAFRQAMHERDVVYAAYSDWQQTHTEFPSVEDVNDGYFGSLTLNLQDLFPQIRRRR